VESLPLERARQIEYVCNRFEAAWKNGESPRIEDFLEGWAGSEWLALLSELISLDTDYRHRRGLPCTPPAERAAFLDKVCGGDHALRQRVAALLHAADTPDNFLGQPPVTLEATVETPPLEGPGSRVGPYKLLEQIGEGGMGTVFLAEQQEPVRRSPAWTRAR
jgi:hypothetical protein